MRGLSNLIIHICSFPLFIVKHIKVIQYFHLRINPLPVFILNVKIRIQSFFVFLVLFLKNLRPSCKPLFHDFITVHRPSYECKCPDYAKKTAQKQRMRSSQSGGQHTGQITSHGGGTRKYHGIATHNSSPFAFFDDGLYE